MKIVSTNLRRLYTSDHAKTNQPYHSLDVEFLQGSLPEVDETVVLEDGNLRIGVQAKVIEHLEGKKVNVLVPMGDIYSLDPNEGIPKERNDDSYFYPPSHSPSVSEGTNPYSSFNYPQNTPSHKPRSDVEIIKVKSFSIFAVLALVLSALCLYLFFAKEEYVGMFLLLNSPLEGLFYLSDTDVREVDLVKIIGWVITLAPFLAVSLCWRHWKEDGDGISGVFGSLASSLAAGFSSLLLLAIMAMRGWFGNLLDNASSSTDYGATEQLVSAESSGLIIWLSISALWFLVTLTGIAAKK